MSFLAHFDDLIFEAHTRHHYRLARDSNCKLTIQISNDSVLSSTFNNCRTYHRLKRFIQNDSGDGMALLSYGSKRECRQCDEHRYEHY